MRLRSSAPFLFLVSLAAAGCASSADPENGEQASRATEDGACATPVADGAAYCGENAECLSYQKALTPHASSKMLACMKSQRLVSGGPKGSIRNNCMPQVLTDSCLAASVEKELVGTACKGLSNGEQKQCARFSSILKDVSKKEYQSCVAREGGVERCFYDDLGGPLLCTNPTSTFTKADCNLIPTQDDGNARGECLAYQASLKPFAGRVLLECMHRQRLVSGGEQVSLRNNCVPELLELGCTRASASLESDACNTAVGASGMNAKCAERSALLVDGARAAYLRCLTSTASKEAGVKDCFFKLEPPRGP